MNDDDRAMAAWRAADSETKRRVIDLLKASARLGAVSSHSVENSHPPLSIGPESLRRWD